MLRTGICGTDLHVRAWDPWAQGVIRPPVVLGHEIAGRVVELGSGVDTVDVGDLVSVEGHIVCGRCRYCLAGRRQLCPNTVSVGIDRDGGFAELVAVPATNVWRHRSRASTPTSRRSSTRSATRSTRRCASRCSARTS